MKNKIPKLVKELLKKYDIYYNCCDVCNVRCCKGHTILTIDDIDYIVDTTGVVPVLVQYPIVPVAVAPTTLINDPIGTTLVTPTNTTGGCAGGFISQVVTITRGGLSIPITSYPVDLCTALNGLVVAPGTTSLTITSTVTTACGKDTDTYVLSIDQAAGVITGVNGVSCLPPPLKDTLVDTDNNANGYGCNGGVLVYPFSIDLTARGGTKVAVTSDADIIAAYAALPIPIAVTISGCDILLPNGETPTDIEVECLYDYYDGDFSITYPDLAVEFPIPIPGNRFTAGTVISLVNMAYNGFGSNVIFSYTLSAAEAASANSVPGLVITSQNATIETNALAVLNNSLEVYISRVRITSTSIQTEGFGAMTAATPAYLTIDAQLLINGVVPADATATVTSSSKTDANLLTP